MLAASGTFPVMCYLAVCVCRGIRLPNCIFSAERVQLVFAEASNVLRSSASWLAWSSLASVLPLVLSADCGLLSLCIVGDVTMVRWLTLSYATDSGMLCVCSL